MHAINERLWVLLHLGVEKRKTVKTRQTECKGKEIKQFRGEIVAEDS